MIWYNEFIPRLQCEIGYRMVEAQLEFHDCSRAGTSAVCTIISRLSDNQLSVFGFLLRPKSHSLKPRWLSLTIIIHRMTHFFSSLPHIEDCPKRIRAYINGVRIIDTKKAKLVYVNIISSSPPWLGLYVITGKKKKLCSWLHPYYPTYYFSQFKLDSPYISAPKEVDGDKKVYTITVGQSGPKSLTLHTTGKLAGLATVKFSEMDAWFEEDEEIFLHPKDPYKVCLCISRVRIKIFNHWLIP